MSATPSVDPHERLSHAKHRLTFLATLLSLTTSGEGEVIDLEHPDNQSGLYFTLHSIADDIGAALDDLGQGAERDCPRPPT